MKTKLCLTLASAALVALQPLMSTAQNISPAAGSTLTPDQAAPEGFVMINNRVHVVRRGVAAPLEGELVLRVTPTGLIGFDEVPRIINNNSMMTLDGRIVAAPAGVALPPPALVEAAELPDSRLAQGSLMYGTNVTGLMPAQRTIAPQSRFVSAKKSSSAKSKTKTASSRKASAKSAPKKKAPAPVRFPAFDDGTLDLPDLELNDEGGVTPVIDATSTMLYMTNTPSQPLSPEDVSIGASLGGTIGQTTEAQLNTVTPQPELPQQSEGQERDKTE